MHYILLRHHILNEMKVEESLVMQVSISSLQPTWISLSSSFSSANVCLGLFLHWNEQKEKKIVTTTRICEYAIPPIIEQATALLFWERYWLYLMVHEIKLMPNRIKISLKYLVNFIQCYFTYVFSLFLSLHPNTASARIFRTLWYRT